MKIEQRERDREGKIQKRKGESAFEEGKRKVSPWTVKGLNKAKARPPKPVCSNIITQREIDRPYATELEPHYKQKFFNSPND